MSSIKEMPPQLTDSFISEQAERYKNTKESVCNVEWIKEALLKLSNNKCTYGEGKLNLKSEYMEVEHFRDKKDYPDYVLLWDNLCFLVSIVMDIKVLIK